MLRIWYVHVRNVKGKLADAHVVANLSQSSLDQRICFPALWLTVNKSFAVPLFLLVTVAAKRILILVVLILVVLVVIIGLSAIVLEKVGILFFAKSNNSNFRSAYEIESSPPFVLSGTTAPRPARAPRAPLSQNR